MDQKARRHWRRIEVLAIVFFLTFVPAFFLTEVVPEGRDAISAPTTIVSFVAPIVSAWILIELMQLFVAIKRPGEREFSSTALANFYFLAWVVFVAFFFFILYVALGDIEWVNYFYDQLPLFTRLWLIAFTTITWLKLVPIIFYKRYRPR